MKATTTARKTLTTQTDSPTARSEWLNENLLTAVPRSLDELERIVTEVGRAPWSWRHAVRFDADRWGRRVLYKTPHLEIVVFGWSEGQETAFHDHGGASGAAFVCSGGLVEDVVESDGDRLRPRTHLRPANSVFSFGPADVHRVRHDPAQGVAVSIHAYTPSASEASDYELLPDGTLRILDPDRELQPA